MIRITRPKGAPDVLLNAGEQETQRNCKRYEANGEAYLSKARKFEFKRSIYAHETVKNALLGAQNKKCCYCESKFRATSPGAVEHFRPKGAVKREFGTGRLYPGYYWLAYEWNNLLVSCERCNSSYKGSLFPLKDESKRARSHHDCIETETPVFVDPAGEDPREHIQFRRAEVEYRTERGSRTIEGLGLQRDDLEEARAEVLDRLEIFCLMIDVLESKVQPDKIERARRFLDQAICSEAEFSAMARDFLAARGVKFEKG